MNKKLFETLLIQDGEMKHRSFHEERMNRSRRELFKISDDIAIPSLHDVPPKGLFRCKIVYSESIEEITIEPCDNNRIFKSFKIIQENIDYSYKYLNRDHLNSLYSQKGDCDDILIIKNGYVADTSIANISIYLENTWFTPANPLLKGTTRARYLKDGSIKERNCSKDDLLQSKKIALMNALLDFYVIEKPIFI